MGSCSSDLAFLLAPGSCFLLLCLYGQYLLRSTAAFYPCGRARLWRQRVHRAIPAVLFVIQALIASAEALSCLETLLSQKHMNS